MEFNKAALIDDVRKYMRTFGETYTKQAAEKFYQAAKETIIDVFYGAYPPKYYDRTFDLMNNSYYKYLKNNGNIMYGGVVISDRDMSDYQNTWAVVGPRKISYGQNFYDTLYEIPSVTPASAVVAWTWLHGYHGYLNRDPGQPIYTFPPISALEMKVGELIGPLQDEASSAAKSQSYSVLQF